MRILPLLFALLPGLSTISRAQDASDSPTKKMKESVHEWIGTMREIQREEDHWERDREVLEDQRDALRAEIEDLQKLVADAKADKAGAAEGAKSDTAKRESLVKAKDLLGAEVRKLEEELVPMLDLLPQPLAEDPRVKELTGQVRKDVTLKGDDASKGLTKRLNNVLNLLSEAEKWQQTIHLKDELRVTGDGKKLNMKVVYFGLAGAYAVDAEGEYGMVGRPGSEGWEFIENNDLAPAINELVTVLNGDADAKFTNLPIQLK